MVCCGFRHSTFAKLGHVEIQLTTTINTDTHSLLSWYCDTAGPKRFYRPLLLVTTSPTKSIIGKLHMLTSSQCHPSAKISLLNGLKTEDYCGFHEKCSWKLLQTLAAATRHDVWISMLFFSVAQKQRKTTHNFKGKVLALLSWLRTRGVHDPRFAKINERSLILEPTIFQWNNRLASNIIHWSAFAKKKSTFPISQNFKFRLWSKEMPDCKTLQILKMFNSQF